MRQSLLVGLIIMLMDVKDVTFTWALILFFCYWKLDSAHPQNNAIVVSRMHESMCFGVWFQAVDEDRITVKLF